jgi:hypothetical protein
MKFILLNFLLVFISCQTKQELVLKKLQGDWAIDEISYKNQNYKERLYMNTLFIEKNGIISFPDTFDFEEESTIFDCNLVNNQVFLIIKCKNEVFSGVYNVKFIKYEEKKLLGIELISNNTKIVAYKFLQNFEVDGEFW